MKTRTRYQVNYTRDGHTSHCYYATEEMAQLKVGVAKRQGVTAEYVGQVEVVLPAFLQ